MCYFAILGPCDPQHDIYTSLGNLHTEAVLITVKEMSLGTSLVPQPATCWEWFLEHFSLAWALPRGVLAGTGWKFAKDLFAGFTGWMVVFHIYNRHTHESEQVVLAATKFERYGSLLATISVHLPTESLIMSGTFGFLSGDERIHLSVKLIASRYLTDNRQELELAVHKVPEDWRLADVSL